MMEGQSKKEIKKVRRGRKRGECPEESGKGNSKTKKSTDTLYKSWLKPWG